MTHPETNPDERDDAQDDPMSPLWSRLGWE
ncbi:hypothetical protein BJ981_000198 [Sphaerisporangium krabiense]|uniref:Uncharacterized protein n=1 Tax=Sphaerisporangium krabiense TaxID=763782 RepID=A0A7W8YZ60_9ACTN|nr:hypothetical protein [Sphaerisporangium krabiense]